MQTVCLMAAESISFSLSFLDHPGSTLEEIWQSVAELVPRPVRAHRLEKHFWGQWAHFDAIISLKPENTPDHTSFGLTMFWKPQNVTSVFPFDPTGSGLYMNTSEISLDNAATRTKSFFFFCVTCSL